jgi:uroporphyrinogen decarboxylase
MNKKERVDAVLRGEKADRVPVSVWGHDYEREWDVRLFAEATAENYNRYDWDYVKVNPRASYMAEEWKASYRPSGQKYQAPVCESTPIRGATDWKRIRPLEPDQGTLGEQLRALQLINYEVGHDAYFVQTLFCPLGVARYLAGVKNEPILLTMREDRNALHIALRIITETLISYAIACLEMGAHGIFYATNGWASSGLLTQDQYREFGEQYDLEIMDAIKSRSKFNILHNSGPHIYFDLLASYPVQAINWSADMEGNPDLRAGHLSSGKVAMGGINERQTLLKGSASQVQDDIGLVLEQMDGQGLLLAPGGAIAPQTPTKNLEAIRRALS